MRTLRIRFSVIPVKTGIHSFQQIGKFWIPACAGMTIFFAKLSLLIKTNVGNRLLNPQLKFHFGGYDRCFPAGIPFPGAPRNLDLQIPQSDDNMFLFFG
jgi:hypothetical protein